MTRNPFKDYDDADRLAVKQLRKGVNGWKILIVLSILMGVLCVALLSQAEETVEEARQSSTSQSVSESSPGKQVALHAVSAYLHGDSTPCPGGVRDLSWDTVRRVGVGKDTNGKSIAYYSHTFSFISLPDGQARQVSQLVAVQKNVASPVGSPSLIVSTVEGATSDMSAPDGYQSYSASDTLQNVLQAWAKAYVGAKSSDLTVAVADPSSSHAYQPANLGVFQSVTVQWGVRLSDDPSKWADGKDPGSLKYVALSVSISFTPSRGEDKSASTTLMILVANPASGSAHVVDWQPTGIIQGLKPYSHAVDSSQLDSKEGSDGQEE